MINLAPAAKIELLELTKDELRQFMVELGEKPFRARYLHDATAPRRITDFHQMTDLPKTLRRLLDERAAVTHTRIESVFTSSDGTRRVLLKLGDNPEVEAVFMQIGRGD